jgi:hypothetical protein
VIVQVEQMVMEDHRLTVRQIAANAGISVGSVDTILHEDLKLRKVFARWVWHGGGSFGLFSHDVRPSVNCHTHEHTFFSSFLPSLHVSLNCWWIPMGFMPCKWRNRIITGCSSNVMSPFSVSKTLLSLYDVTSIQRVGQCCHLASPNLENSHVFYNNFHVSICFHSQEKKLWDLRPWMHHVNVGWRHICTRGYSTTHM